ncbi:MAG TPA: hypothetical protein VIK27_10175 [Candidatus Aquilonibacter sp.]
MDRLTRLLYGWLLPRPGAWSPTYTGAAFEAYRAFRSVVGPATITFVLAGLVADFDLPPWGFAVAFAVGVAAFAVGLRAAVVYARSWDEMQRSLLLNAAALAFCGTVGAIFFNAELQAHGYAHLSPERTGLLAVVLFICCLWAVRHLADRDIDA